MHPAPNNMPSILQSNTLGLVHFVAILTQFRQQTVAKDVYRTVGDNQFMASSSQLQLAILGLSQPVCTALPTAYRLTAAQTKLCTLYPDHMDVVKRGARYGLDECQWQFKTHRWNCSVTTSVSSDASSPSPPGNIYVQETLTHDDVISNVSVVAATGDTDLSFLALNELLSPSITVSTIEVAFRHAILSAGVLYTVARACRDGQLSTCSCSTRPRPDDLDPEWVWGGCGDNTQYGYRFAVGFVDAREREKNYPRHSRQLARMLMNLHNNEAGRRAVYLYTKASCKCHGVSGSCSLRTCWNQLPPFREIGDRLRYRYERGRLVSFNAHGTALQSVHGSPTGSVSSRRRSPKTSRRRATSTATTGRRLTREDLVYVDQSPDYCEADRPGSGVVTGATGTRGRACDRVSTDTDGCGSLCCGRGYDTFRSRVVERCNCKFQWCCYVQCQTCRRTDNIYTCK